MLLLKNISQLVTPTGKTPARGKQMDAVKIYNDAIVAVENGVITYAGAKKSFDESKYTVIDCAGRAVIPGFADSHTHLVFGGHREDEFMWRQQGVSYMDIMNRGGGIASSVEKTRAATEQELIDSALKRIEELKSQGVTSVEIKSGYGLDTETELKQLRAVQKLKKIAGINIASTYMGAHSVPKEYKGRGGEYIKFIIDDMLPRVKKENLAEFVDIFCEKGVFSFDESKELLTAAAKTGFKTKIHADEMVSTGGAELAAEIGCASADHLLHVSKAGVEALSKSNTIATLLPLTAFCLKEPYAPARELIDGSAAVALATDFNPGSCFSCSIPLMIAISVIYMKMSVGEVITALTLNGACAMGLGDSRGTIEAGKAADLIILKYPSVNFLPYHTGINCVDKVIAGGRVIDN